MSICDREDQCRHDTVYWFPLSSAGSLDIYCTMNSIDLIKDNNHFTNLLSGGIIKQLTPQE